MVTLAEAAEELYAALPGQFVDRREELTRQARAEGDRVLAGRIKALRRPTVAAWVLNTLVREGSTPLTDLLAVGAELRVAQATLDRDAMKALTTKRQRAERAVLADATARFADRGETLTSATLTEIEHTLRAAVADPQAAAAVAGGQLVRPLSYAGFGEVDLTAATATPPRPSAAADEPASDTPSRPEVAGNTVIAFPRRGPDPEPEDDPEVLAARQELRRAQQHLARVKARRDEAAARRDVATARERARAARENRRQAQDRVTDLLERLDRARGHLNAAQQRAAGADAALAEAEARLASVQQAREVD